MIILDTNIISAIMLREPDTAVINWLNSVAVESIWLTSITIFETRFGLALLPDSKRRHTLTNQFKQVVETDLSGRVFSFDQDAANSAAALAAMCRKSGKTVDMRDTFIAGIALSRKAVLATRNTKHFLDLTVEVINPWKLKNR